MNRPPVPEDLEREPFITREREAAVTSLVRAAIACSVAKLAGGNPVDYGRKAWPDDRQTDYVVRAATSPASTANTPALVTATGRFRVGECDFGPGLLHGEVVTRILAARSRSARFQNNSDLAQGPLPICPSKVWRGKSIRRQEGYMAPKPNPARFVFTVGMVLAMTLTILTVMTWAAPSSSPIYHPQLLLLY